MDALLYINPVPKIGYDMPSATFVALKTNRDVDAVVAPSVSEHEHRNDSIRAIFDALNDDGSVTLVDPAEYVCDAGYCRVAIDNTLLCRDDNPLQRLARGIWRRCSTSHSARRDKGSCSNPCRTVRPLLSPPEAVAPTPQQPRNREQ